MGKKTERGSKSAYLHADDGIYKEQHHYKQGYIGQCLREGEREILISHFTYVYLGLQLGKGNVLIFYLMIKDIMKNTL